MIKCINNNNMQISKQLRVKTIYIGAALAAVLYSSWLVGYFVNPSVALKGTASELAAFGQPWRLLFVGLDIATSIILLFIGIMLITLIKRRLHKLVAALYMAFACGVFLTAIFSLNCVSVQAVCSHAGHIERMLVHITIGTCGLSALFIASMVEVNIARQNSIVKKSSKFLYIGAGLGLLSLALPALMYQPYLIAGVQRAFLVIVAYVIWLIPTTLLSIISGQKETE